MTDLFTPLQSLEQGHWFKLICGASLHHLPVIRSLTLAYTLAGADCIDVAADPAVISAAQEGLQVARQLLMECGKSCHVDSLPLLMVSLNDGEDPHFRKAEFNPQKCPEDCPRPCEAVCPAQAIASAGVVSEKCYGCGRCIPVCPYDNFYTKSYILTPQTVAPLVMSTGIDAVEIHTKVGRLREFRQLWQAITPWVNDLKVVAVSCGDAEGLRDYLREIADIISPISHRLIWQTDGRPMSGDIGMGTTLAAVKLGQKVLAANLPGFVQLAGGTNNYTVAKLKEIGLLKGSHGQTRHYVSGVAYGSYARVLLSPILEQLEHQEVNQGIVKAKVNLEEKPELLWQAVDLAQSLVSQIKSQQR